MDENNTLNEELEPINSGCLLLRNLIDRFEYSYNLLSNEQEESFYKKPFFCLEDFLYFKENFQLLINIIDFNEFQIKYCKKLLTFIKKYINDDVYSYELELDEEGYYYILVSMNFQNKYHNLLYLYPFTRIIYIPENEYRQKILNKINNCELTIKELKENEKLLMVSKKNPIMASENPIEMFKISFNQKKYKMKYTNSLKENDNNINECYKQIADYKSELDEVDNFEMCLDLNRENFLLDINKSPFEFYLNNENEEKYIESTTTDNKLLDNENISNNIKNEYVKKENPIDDIEFFE